MEAPQTSAAATQLKPEHYAFGTEIHRSAGGSVYLARHRPTRTHVVLKERLRPELGKNALLHHELELYQKVPQHPSLVKCLGHFHRGGDARAAGRASTGAASTRRSLVMVFEYCSGGDLHTLLQKQRASGRYLSQRRVLTLFTQVAAGVRHLHAHSVVHRDLKSLNVVLAPVDCADGGLNVSAKICDLGVSRAKVEDDLYLQTFCGTPAYLSPELIGSQPYSEKSDVWSLGVLLYELCSLQLPFQGRNLAEISRMIARGAFAPLPSHVSPQVSALVADMLTLDVELRPASEEVLQRAAAVLVELSQQKRSAPSRRAAPAQVLKLGDEGEGAHAPPVQAPSAAPESPVGDERAGVDPGHDAVASSPAPSKEEDIGLGREGGQVADAPSSRSTPEREDGSTADAPSSRSAPLDDDAETGSAPEGAPATDNVRPPPGGLTPPTGAVEEELESTVAYASTRPTLGAAPPQLATEAMQLPGAPVEASRPSPPLAKVLEPQGRAASSMWKLPERPASVASSVASGASSVRELRLEQRKREYENSLVDRPSSAASSYAGPFQRNLSTPDLESMRQGGALQGKDLQAYLLAQRMADLHASAARAKATSSAEWVPPPTATLSTSASLRHVWRPVTVPDATVQSKVEPPQQAPPKTVAPDSVLKSRNAGGTTKASQSKLLAASETALQPGSGLPRAGGRPRTAHYHISRAFGWADADSPFAPRSMK